MNFEPQKFYIGLTDFFSILLPGALITYFGMERLGPPLLGESFPRLTGTMAAIVFLFSSYLLGHFVFLLGSWLLDDLVYDRIRSATWSQQIRHLAGGGRLAARWMRRLARLLVSPFSDRAVTRATRIKAHDLDPLRASSAINTFQWCKARLIIDQPNSMATVERFEADSKFFRSLVVVLVLLLPWGFAIDRPALVVAALLLLPLALWRYIDQRGKASNQAYWHVIALESRRADGFRVAEKTREDRPSHAGGVVFRREKDQVEFLLVEARRTPGERVLPKGHVEEEEPAPEAAVREVREETGVWARIVDKLGVEEYRVGNDSVRVQYYLMEALEENAPLEPSRRHWWRERDQAIREASHELTSQTIALASQRVPPRSRG